jgi:hypothetical protein
MGGNIDPRQMESLPVNGRGWMQLVLLAPGATGNGIFRDPINPASGGNSSPSTTSRDHGNYQIIVDGQQVTTNVSSFQVPYSRDAIAEVELQSSRFDATQGRSMGLLINAVTKSGSNTATGSFAGYFRDDKFNAADFISRTVLPYSDTQLSAVYGGPIVKDKIHIFGNFEYEHEPKTLVFTLPPPWNLTETSNHDERKWGARLDAQLSPEMHGMVRYYGLHMVLPGTGSATRAPTVNNERDEDRAGQLYGRVSQVFSNRAVNEVMGGWSTFREFVGLIRPLNNPTAKFPGNGPQVVLAGMTVGGLERWPTDVRQTVVSLRDDLTLFYNKGGRHTLKLGGDYLWIKFTDVRCPNCDGVLAADLGAIPANIGSLFPDIWDVSTWNLTPLSSISSSFTQSFVPSPDGYASDPARNTFAFWAADDWTVTSRLTMNLGVRYDLQLNMLNENKTLEPFWPTPRPSDKNNVAPRLGFTYSATDKTVVRGGWGIYYGAIGTSYAMDNMRNIILLNTPNDGRPDFASNPYNGRTPTFEEVLARQCTSPPGFRPGCQVRDFVTGNTLYAPDKTVMYAHQASIGFQQQVATDIGFQVDYAFVGQRDYATRQIANISYNPATGVNNPFATVALRPYPDWGQLFFSFNGGRSNSHALHTGFTKRWSHGWQASGTYTLAQIKDQDPPVHSGLVEVPFPLANDLSNPYTLSVGDQRHRAVLNGVFRLPYGFQMAGLYTFGSGERFSSNWNQDLRRLGSSVGASRRLRPDGSIIPRNNFVGRPVHRVDLRIDRRIPLGSRVWVNGILEVFNVFNHENFGRYVTAENLVTFGNPQQASAALAYTPRALQLGFRVGF